MTRLDLIWAWRRLALPRVLRIPFWISYAINLLQVLLILTVIWTIQPVVPLFYTIVNPDQQLVAKEWLIIFPLISTIINLGHTIIVKYLHDQARLLAQLFAWATTLIQVLWLATLVRIIWIIS